MSNRPKIKAGDLITVVFFGTRHYKIVGNNKKRTNSREIRKRVLSIKDGMWSNIIQIKRNEKVIWVKGE